MSVRLEDLKEAYCPREWTMSSASPTSYSGVTESPFYDRYLPYYTMHCLSEPFTPVITVCPSSSSFLQRPHRPVSVPLLVYLPFLSLPSGHRLLHLVFLLSLVSLLVLFQPAPVSRGEVLV